MSERQQEMELERTYPIATVADFAKVPKDRIRACLEEFATALEVQADTADAFSVLAQSPVRVVMDSFTWTDDGADRITIDLEIAAHYPDCPVANGASVDCAPPGECERRRVTAGYGDRNPDELPCKVCGGRGVVPAGLDA